MTFSGAMRSYCLRTTEVSLVVAALFLLSGCWVSSINGLADEGLVQRDDPDVTVDRMLIGTWTRTSEECTSTITVTVQDRTYDLEVKGQGQRCDEGKNIYSYRAHLLKLDNRFFLDVFPKPDDVCELCLPIHWIFRIEFDKESMSLIPIDSEWLKKAMGQKIVVLATLPDDTDRLTASAKELKAFCRKYAANKEVFAPVPDFVFFRRK